MSTLQTSPGHSTEECPYEVLLKLNRDLTTFIDKELEALRLAPPSSSSPMDAHQKLAARSRLQELQDLQERSKEISSRQTYDWHCSFNPESYAGCDYCRLGPDSSFVRAVNREYNTSKKLQHVMARSVTSASFDPPDPSESESEPATAYSDAFREVQRQLQSALSPVAAFWHEFWVEKPPTSIFELESAMQRNGQRLQRLSTDLRKTLENVERITGESTDLPAALYDRSLEELRTLQGAEHLIDNLMPSSYKTTCGDF